tara:strand:- start:1088 stop:1519 length:432 start_codon:yes stop_codon:yes gene_type:complete
MNTQNRVNKLMFSKTELSTEKVELSVADDVNKMRALADNIMKQVSATKAGIKEDNKLNTELDKEIKKRAKASTDLVNKTDKFVDEISDAHSKIAKVTQDAYKAAKSLGVDPSAIKGLDALIKIEDKLLDERKLVDNFKVFNWI